MRATAGTTRSNNLCLRIYNTDTSTMFQFESDGTYERMFLNSMFQFNLILIMVIIINLIRESSQSRFSLDLEGNFHCTGFGYSKYGMYMVYIKYYGLAHEILVF